MTGVLVALGMGLAGLLVGAGVWFEVRAAASRRPDTQPYTAPAPVIRPLAPRGAAVSAPGAADSPPEPPPGAVPAPAVETAHAEIERAHWRQRAAALLTGHPAPLLGWLETAFWLCVVLSAVDHALSPNDSYTGLIVYWLTIGPHELGHLFCMPFGWLIMVAGGSIWQVLWWVIPAVYLFYGYRRVSGSLLFWALVGHSFINLTPYIRDARARELPLLFNLDSSHHDWWNLLRTFGLLEYDQAIGLLATVIGALILLATAGLGLLTTWALPRPGPGRVMRFEWPFWSHLGAALRGASAPAASPVAVLPPDDAEHPVPGPD